jgi:hypothetical protein
MGLNAKSEYLLIEVNQPKISVINSINEQNQLEPNQGYAGFIIINNTNKTQSWSPHFYKSLGFYPDEIVPSFESLEKILHPSDFVVIEKILQDYKLNLNKDLNIKVRYKTKYKTYIIWNTRVKIICNEVLSN